MAKDQGYSGPFYGFLEVMANKCCHGVRALKHEACRLKPRTKQPPPSSLPEAVNLGMSAEVFQPPGFMFKQADVVP